MTNKFVPFTPSYTRSERLQRIGVVGQTIAKSLLKTINPKAKIGVSIEITDRCNAGCNYCYVYPPEWNQAQRMQGYAHLNAAENHKKQEGIYKQLQKLKDEGYLHVTLVGGEPALAPDVIQFAGELFPIVWLVTNGSIKLPPLPRSVTIFVSMDGLPEEHNLNRDPNNNFGSIKYGELEGMTAVIVKNINESERGAFVHLTLRPSISKHLDRIVDWLVKDVHKLRGVVISGTTCDSKDDPSAYSINDRKLLGEQIKKVAAKYGWNIFPFNKPKTNSFLFEEKHIIRNSKDCSISKRILSLDYEGKSTGKCVLRDDADCETCMCNMTGLLPAMESFDLATLNGNAKALFG